MGCVWLIYRKWGYAIGGNIVTRKRSLIPWGIINRLKIPNGHRHTNFHDYYKACEVQTAEPSPPGLCYLPSEKPSLGPAVAIMAR